MTPEFNETALNLGLRTDCLPIYLYMMVSIYSLRTIIPGARLRGLLSGWGDIPQGSSTLLGYKPVVHGLCALIAVTHDYSKGAKASNQI